MYLNCTIILSVTVVCLAFYLNCGMDIKDYESTIRIQTNTNTSLNI